MKKKVYIETSVISYMVSEMSDNIRIASHQFATQEMWHLLSEYNVFVSDIVVDECSRGNKQQAEKRLEYIHDFVILEITEQVQAVAEQLLSEQAIPRTCPEDALHIASAAVNNIDFMLTWNFKHINNPFMKKQIESVIRKTDREMPVICSPEELLEAENE